MLSQIYCGRDISETYARCTKLEVSKKYLKIVFRIISALNITYLALDTPVFDYVTHYAVHWGSLLINTNTGACLK